MQYCHSAKKWSKRKVFAVSTIIISRHAGNLEFFDKDNFLVPQRMAEKGFFIWPED